MNFSSQVFNMNISVAWKKSFISQHYLDLTLSILHHSFSCYKVRLLPQIYFPTFWCQPFCYICCFLLPWTYMCCSSIQISPLEICPFKIFRNFSSLSAKRTISCTNQNGIIQKIKLLHLFLVFLLYIKIVCLFLHYTSVRKEQW